MNIHMSLFLVSILFAGTGASADDGKRPSAVCNADFEEVYYAKRSCVINNDQTACHKLGELNALGFGVAAVGGASATAAIAKMYNQFLLNKTDTAKVNNMLSDLRNEFNLTKQAQAKFEQLLGRVLI